ncbi:hypothetical protein MtrunA17_Chr6g0459631 [Medicago truncatula]|uniref:KIB1-4 beta-propeller domain-containing protein n=1 Tax=Medicago truncatula TaxID=3880 RepID=A0A072U7X2_MEDTR|nr:hypothetical protein MTR_6g023955 [Medicago truncatula]RHN50637.1 hypothetical protein MtrunA17_Chr6g0459631 [Medicago truncatula]
MGFHPAKFTASSYHSLITRGLWFKSWLGSKGGFYFETYNHNPTKSLQKSSFDPSTTHLHAGYIYRRVRYYECNVHKVILSENPTIRLHNYVVVAISSTRKCLAFIKAGQKFWTYVDDDYFCFSDVIFYKGLVYAAGRWNNIVSFDICNSKDSIYYTDDYFEEALHPYPNGPFDMKTYNVKDGSFSDHCPFEHWFAQMPPSLWVLPPYQWE